MKENSYFLSHLFGSKESILTSFLQFQYQLFFIKDNFWYQKLKKFKQKDEEHLNWLAKFLIQEGEMPIYADRLYGSVLYWNGYDVYYDTDLKTMIEVDITLKKKMIQNTEMVIYVTEDEKIEELLKKILIDEYKTLEELMTLHTCF